MTLRNLWNESCKYLACNASTPKISELNALRIKLDFQKINFRGETLHSRARLNIVLFFVGLNSIIPVQ